MGAVQAELIKRAGIDPAVVGQVIGGCIGQLGQQSFNVTRTACLTAGLPMLVPTTTVNIQPASVVCPSKR
ncbi:MAG: hypothetical protein ACLP9Y_14085 [Mycobacterium sp.]